MILKMTRALEGMSKSQYRAEVQKAFYTRFPFPLAFWHQDSHMFLDRTKRSGSRGFYVLCSRVTNLFESCRKPDLFLFKDYCAESLEEEVT